MITVRKNIAVIFVPVFISVVLVMSLISYQICLGVHTFTDSNGIIHGYLWLPYVSCIGALGGLIFFLNSNRYRKFAWVYTLIFLLIYVLSVRTIVFNHLTGQISEYWFGILVSTKDLPRMESQGYCYKVTPFLIHLTSLQDKENISYFRGMWPSILLENTVGGRSSPFEQCA